MMRASFCRRNRVVTRGSIKIPSQAGHGSNRLAWVFAVFAFSCILASPPCEGQIEIQRGIGGSVGSIARGSSSNGSLANAITFTGGINSLEINAGSNILGNVGAFS
jgi:hypothetical protein